MKTKITVLFLVIIAAFIFATPLNGVLADGDYVIHKVLRGENLTSIAKQYDVTVKEIIDLNEITTPSLIVTGQLLKISVKQDETQVEENTAEKETVETEVKPPVTTEVVDTPVVRTGNNISFKNADLRDIFTAMALSMNVNIIYTESPSRTTFEMRNTSVRVAFEYLVQTLSLEFVEQGNMIVVGRKETLQKDFTSQMPFTRYDLRYIKVGVLSQQLDVLGFDVKKVIIEENDRAIWLQGTPKTLSKIRELTRMIDVPENELIIVEEPEEEEEVKEVILTPIELTYITAEVFETIVRQVNIPTKMLIVEANPQTLWVDAQEQALKDVENLAAAVDIVENYEIIGMQPLELYAYSLNFVSPEEINRLVNELGIDVKTIYFDTNPTKIWVDARSRDIFDFEEIVNKVDRMENAQWPINMISVKLKNISASRLKEVAAEINLDAQLLTLDSNAYTVWIIGDSRAIMDVRFLINDLDRDILNKANSFFIYTLSNISPSEAVKRFEYLDNDDTQLLTLNYPEYSREVLVVGPGDRRVEIQNILMDLDRPGVKIRIPIDYSTDTSGAYRLALRRDLLVSLTGIPAGSFHISNNVSRDATPYYIMWVEETPDNILKVRNMIDTIHNP